jgi:hypothetical protein
VDYQTNHCHQRDIFLYMKADMHQPNLFGQSLQREEQRRQKAMGGERLEEGDRRTEPLLEKLSESPSYSSSQEHLVKRTGKSP